MESIIQSEKECFFCKSPYVHKHHIFYGTANRRLSDEDGMIIGTRISSLKGKNIAQCSEKSIAAFIILKRLTTDTLSISRRTRFFNRYNLNTTNIAFFSPYHNW